MVREDGPEVRAGLISGLGLVWSARGIMVVGKSGPRRGMMGVFALAGPNPGTGDSMAHDDGRYIINVINIPTLGPWNMRISSRYTTW